MLVLFNSFLLTLLSTNSFSQAETNSQKNSPKTFTKSKEEEDFTETLLSIKGVKAPASNKIGIFKKLIFRFF